MLAVNTAIVIASVFLMEALAYLTHRYIMHGPIGWGWHKSHHEETEGIFEKNDLYAVVFSVVSGGIIASGIAGVWPLRQIGLGMMIYGVLYFIVHDGLVHQRWPFRYVATKGYLRRLVQAHKMHHAVQGRDGCVSFGFLYAPPLVKLRARLAELTKKRRTAEAENRLKAGLGAATVRRDRTPSDGVLRAQPGSPSRQ
ncbi:MAG: sterol desaturase family protein [Pseudomonadota bacterium]